jgi:polynucleotide 5'-hydroxyl-kinase GRC3/NOL9
MQGEILKIEGKKGDTILLSGPASIYLSSGMANIFESNLQEKKIIIIKKEKQIPIKLNENSSFFLKLGPSSSYRIIQRDPFPFSWKMAINEIIDQGLKKILILGGIDVGKSSFCALLANSILKFGIQSAIIDADIGQSDLGPPTTLGFGLIKDCIEDLSYTEIINLFFVGQTTPSHDFEKVILGIKRLLERANTFNSSLFTIINTDGWIKDIEAKVYKKRLIEEISPELIVCIGKKNDFIGLFNEKKNFILLDSSRHVKKRSKEERKKLREYGYRNYLNGATLKQFKLNRIGLERQIDIFVDRNKIVGFVDREDFLVGIGILKEFDKEKGVIKIFTPVERIDEFQKVDVGFVKISESGKEL